MAEGQLAQLMHRVRRLVVPAAAAAGSDGQLLDRFVHGDSDAFAQLMERHGPMVRGVCRRVLRDSAEAEDVCQATFLVLARKAASIRQDGRLAGWLCRVAFRLALSARAAAAARRRHEEEARRMNPTVTPSPTPDLRVLIDEELNQLPRKYYLPLVLCYLEGKTYEEAAGQLAWSHSTLKGRLTRGREMLRKRLARRGLAYSSAVFAVVLAEGTAPAALPAGMIATTTRSAVAFAAGQATTLGPAVALAETMLRGAAALKIRVVAALVALTLGAAGWAAYVLLDGKPAIEAGADPTPVRPAPPPADPLPVVVRQRDGDAAGDPLPPGARARLGTTRFRPGSRYRAEVVFSANGQWVGASGHSVTAFWDVATGKEALRLQGAPPVARMAWAPDGKTIATIPEERNVLPAQLWDAATGRLLRNCAGDNRAFCATLAFSPDSRSLAVGDENGRLYVWDVATGNSQQTLNTPGGQIHNLAFTADSQSIITAGKDAVIRFWDRRTGKQFLKLIGHDAGPNAGVNAIALAPGGELLASAGDDGSVRLWQLATGLELRTIMAKKEHTPALSLAFSSDGKVLAIGCADQVVHLQETSTGKELHQLPHRIRPDRLPGGIAVAFAPDAKVLATSTDSSAIRLWDPATGREIRRFQGHADGGVNAVAISPDGSRLASAGAGGTVLLWDLANGTPIRSIRTDEASALAFSPDGKRLAGAGLGQSVRVWKTDGSDDQELLRLNGRPSGRAVAFSPDGQVLAVAESHDVQFSDAATGNHVRKLRPTQPGTLDGLTFAPDGRTVIAVSYHGQVCFWETANGREVRSFSAFSGPRADNATVRSVALSAEGNLLAVGGRQAGDKDADTALGVVVWDLARGKCIQSLRIQSATPQGASVDVQVSALAFSPDARLLATAEENAVILWELATGRVIRTYRGHTGPVTSLAFTRDGTAIASGSRDTTILLWDVLGSDPKQAARELEAKELDRLWDDMLAQDPAVAYRACGALAAVPGQALPLVKQRLRNDDPRAGKTVAQRITDLDDDSFAVRQKARQELEKLGEAARPALQQALRDNLSSLEMRVRLEGLLKRLDQEAPIRTEDLRALRALQMLELMGTAEAKQLLEQWANGELEPSLKLQAKAAGGRLERRPRSK